MADDPYRLPVGANPRAYDLTIGVDLDGARFDGTVHVHLTTSSALDELVCNALDLAIGEAWVEPGGGGRIDAVATLDPGTERVHLALASTLPAGDHVLHVAFSGGLNDKLVGFYRSTSTDDDGVAHPIAVTQFEATHARRAFPCWDEPDRKATLRLTLDVPAHLTAIANSEPVSDEPAGEGRRRVTFAETMSMSTYLYAWVVGPFEVTAPRAVAGTTLRVAHAPGRAGLTDFALDAGGFALEWLSAYYGSPYPGDKCDLVAVPDFAFGAMENLGCITFREVLLLIDPARATQPELQRAADVINHELAHMWFGDLVTMKWWNGIWLNEAFATFMELKCTEAFRPEWDRWTDFGIARSAALEVDSLSSTRPIEFEVVSPEEAEGMFDVLTYEKGAAVVRMLEQYLGEEPFRDGIRKYLADNAYGNTETTDLWDALEAATGEPVRRIADSWIFQGGYPVVSAEVVDGTTLVLRQSRFRFDGAGGDERWAVPVILRYGAGEHVHETRVLVDDAENEVPLELEPAWLQLNVGGSGFYRAGYTRAQLEALASRLDALDALERYQLLDDSLAAAMAGFRSSADLLGVLRHFADDTDASVWRCATSVLALLDRVVPSGSRDAFEARVRALVAPALLRLGDHPEPGEPDRTRTLRAVLFELLGTIGNDPSVLGRARELHDSFRADPAAVDPALAAAAVNVVADRGSSDDHRRMMALMGEAATPQDELRYLYALSHVRDPRSFHKVLEMSLNGMRTQNAPLLLARMLLNRELGADAWAFVRDSWDTMVERFPSSMISRVVEGVRGLVDPAVVADVDGFFASRDIAQGAKSIAQALERMRTNAAFCARESDVLAAALSRPR